MYILSPVPDRGLPRLLVCVSVVKEKNEQITGDR
jgi:hypothetical protein